MKKPEEVLAGVFTLLVKLEVFTTKEVNESMKNGYDGVFDLVNNKYKDLLMEGKIKRNT